MARYLGTQNVIVGLFESGTYRNASGNFWPGLVQSHNLEPQEGTFNERYIGGTGRDIDISFQGPKIFRGTLVSHPQNFRFLAWTLGSNVDAGSPSPHTHTMTALDNDVGTAFTSGPMNRFLSFGIQETGVAPGTGANNQRTVKGCIIDEWELAGEMGGILTETTKYIATSGAYASGAASTINAFNYGLSAVGSIIDRPYIFSDVTLSIPSGTIYETLKSFSIKVSNSLIERHYLTGSRDASAPPQPDTRGIMLNTGFDAQSETAKILYESYYQGGSDFNAMLRVNASTGSRDNIITLSGCRIMDPFSSPLGINDIKFKELVIKGKNIDGVSTDLMQSYNPF